MISIDYVVSLGRSCQTHFNIKRKKCNYPHGLPFNASMIESNKVLVELLKSEFSYCYGDHLAGMGIAVPVLSRLQPFTFHHQPIKVFRESGVLDLLHHCISNFLNEDFKKHNLLFLRNTKELKNFEQDKSQIESALKSIGFKNSYVEFCSTEKSEKLFYIDTTPTYKEEYWKGNYNSWDSFFNHLSKKYVIKSYTPNIL